MDRPSPALASLAASARQARRLSYCPRGRPAGIGAPDRAFPERRVCSLTSTRNHHQYHRHCPRHDRPGDQVIPGAPIFVKVAGKQKTTVSRGIAAAGGRSHRPPHCTKGTGRPAFTRVLFGRPPGRFGGVHTVLPVLLRPRRAALAETEVACRQLESAHRLSALDRIARRVLQILQCRAPPT